MKTFILAVAMIMGVALNAQTAEKKISKATPMEFRNAATPEQKAEKRLKYFTTELTLTDKQQKELKQALLTVENERKIVADQNKANKKAGIKLTTEEKIARRGKVIEQKKALKEEFKKILTAEQFTKYEQLKEEKKPDVKPASQHELKPSQK